jgi:hypothetical protein
MSTMDTVAARTQVGGPVIWDLEIAPRLTVDEARLRRRLRIAGLGGLIVTTHVHDGTARRERITIEAPYEKVLRRSTNDIPLANYAWPVLTVDINRARAMEQVARAGGDPARAWADVVDRSVRAGIWRGAVRTLLNVGGDLTPRLASLLLAVMVVVLLSSHYVLAGLVFYAGAMLFEIGLNSIINKVMYGRYRLDRRRWSLLPGVMHLDRLLVCAVLRGTGRLVSAGS